MVVKDQSPLALDQISNWSSRVKSAGELAMTWSVLNETLASCSSATPWRSLTRRHENFQEGTR